MTAQPMPALGTFRLRRHDDHLVLQQPTYDRQRLVWSWQTIARLDRVWAANLACELDAWLAGTDHLPEVAA